MNLVFELSKATANDRCVLLVLADHAHDDGSSAYPSHATIAAKAGGIADRTVRDCLTRLVSLGEIEREGWSPKHTISYRITLQDNPAEAAGSNLAGSDTEPGGSTQTTRQPSADEVTTEPTTESTPPKSPPSDPEFEDWMQDHEQVTGHRPHRAGTKALTELAASYRARRAEGWTVVDLKLATLGAHADDHRRDNGYDVAESVVRPKKVGDLVAKGRMRHRRRSSKGGVESRSRFGDARRGMNWARTNLPDQDPHLVAAALKDLEANRLPISPDAVLERLRASECAQGGTETPREETPA